MIKTYEPSKYLHLSVQKHFHRELLIFFLIPIKVDMRTIKEIKLAVSCESKEEMK